MVTLLWHSGTGYDFFVSLYVLHHPGEFGLRPSWAAGVRSRLPAEQRDFLEHAQSFLHVPMTWFATLQTAQCDAADALAALERLSAEKRFEALSVQHNTPLDLKQALNGIAERGAWNAADLEAVRVAYARRYTALHNEDLKELCNAWARPAEFSERYLEVLRTYYQVFFAEEEERIRPVLKKGLEEAQELANRLSPGQLVERLSRGVQLPQVDELIQLDLALSYWSSPLIFSSPTGPGRMYFLFGVRSEPAGLVPGDHVPGGLVETLKALADPTRLRILRYLSREPMTPSQLSRQLRLRAPTVVHHLKELRLAGLVQISFLVEDEKRYALRREALDGLRTLMEDFLSGELPVDETPAESGGRVESDE
nr:hypothetical protein [uncultured bacterium]